jgi:RHS repeat-associated protein
LYLCGDAYSAPAVIEQENGTWSLYYIGRDYQGSITHIFSEDGTVKQELSYDAWGRLRNPANQEVYAIGSEPELFLGRGYTGHEHLTPFGLINMNARLYDAALGRFLSPDPYIQDMTNSQNYNRYSYCLNNPLKYTDPSGEYYYWDSDSRCYRDELGNQLNYSDVHMAMLQSGYFRPGGSMFSHTSLGYSYGFVYGSKYSGYGFSGYNPVIVKGLQYNSRDYFWFQTPHVEGFYDQYGYHPTAIGVTSTRVTFKQQAQDWLKATSFMSKYRCKCIFSIRTTFLFRRLLAG